MYPFEPLLRSFRHVYPLPDGVKEALYKHLKYMKLPRKHMILKKGQACDSIYFVTAGILRAYYKHKGEESTICFYQKGDVFTGAGVLAGPRPSEQYLEALAGTEVIAIKRRSLRRLCKLFPEFLFIINHITERALSNANDTIAILRKKGADEKLRQLKKLYPRLRTRVKCMHLASFMNITAETFSRIRHEVEA